MCLQMTHLSALSGWTLQTLRSPLSHFMPRAARNSSKNCVRQVPCSLKTSIRLSRYFAVGMTNSAPFPMASGQRCITLL